MGGGGYLCCIGLNIGWLGVEVTLGLLPGCTGGVPPLGRGTPGLGATDGQVRLGGCDGMGRTELTINLAWAGVGGRIFWFSGFWAWVGVGSYI